MSTDLLRCLDRWRIPGAAPGPAALERALRAAIHKPFRTAAELIRLHEILLFLRAYPPF